MNEFNEDNNNNEFNEKNDNPVENLKELIKDDSFSNIEFEEESGYESNEVCERFDDVENDNVEEILEQEDNEKLSVEEIEETSKKDRSLENMSYDELVEKYNDVRKHDSALGQDYAKYGEQIAEISRDKNYYSEKEWNNYIDEKINAQNDVSARRYQIQSEMRKMETEMSKRKR